MSALLELARRATRDHDTMVADALSPAQEAALRAWLVSIKETDTAIVTTVLAQCRRDPEARGYFLAQAGGIEAFEEGAAILEFDGGKTRAEAERRARRPRLP